MLVAIGVLMAAGLGQLPAVLALAGTEQPAQVGLGPQARFFARTARSDTGSHPGHFVRGGMQRRDQVSLQPRRLTWIRRRTVGSHGGHSSRVARNTPSPEHSTQLQL